MQENLVKYNIPYLRDSTLDIAREIDNHFAKKPINKFVLLVAIVGFFLDVYPIFLGDDVVINSLKALGRAIPIEAANRLGELVPKLLLKPETFQAGKKLLDFLCKDQNIATRLLKNTNDAEKLCEFFAKYGDEARTLFKNISKKYGDDITERIWHNPAYADDAVKKAIFKDLDTISNVNGAGKLADDISTCNNLGKAFEAEVAAKNVSNVAEVSKPLKTTSGSTDIDVFLEDGTIIEAKRFDFSKYPPGSSEYNDLKADLGRKIKIWYEHSATCNKKVVFKGSVEDGIKTWLEEVKKVVVEVIP
ncbi:MAG: hypothetical protein AB1630_11490 [bacterium]